MFSFSFLIFPFCVGFYFQYTKEEILMGKDIDFSRQVLYCFFPVLFILI